MASLRWSLAGILLVVGLALAHHVASSGPGPSPSGYLPLVLKGLPSATPASGTLQVLPNHQHFVTHPDEQRTSVRVVGEVRNLLGYDIDAIILRAFLYKDGQRVGVGYGTVPLQVIPNGVQTCFAIQAELQGHVAVDGYMLTLVGYQRHDEPYHWLRLEDVTGEADGSEYILRGLSYHDAGPLLESARAAGTLYDASGAVVDCNASDLDHNHESDRVQPFSIVYGQREHYDDVARWNVQAIGSP